MGNISIYVFSFLLSACSICYEILISRLVSSFTDNYVLSQSATIATFILSLGVGSYFSKHIKKDFLAVLLIAELFLVLFAFITLPALLFIQVFVQQSDLNYASKSFLLLLLPQLFMFIIGFTSGFEIPLFLKQLQVGSSEKKLGLLFGLTYFGSLVGTLLVSHFLIPQIGLFDAYVTIVSFALLLTVFLFMSVKNQATGFSRYLAGFVLLCSLVFITQSKKINGYYLKAYYYGLPTSFHIQDLAGFPEVYRVSSKYQEIDLVPTLGAKSDQDFALFLDNKLQFTAKTERSYHEPMVHGALNLNDLPAKKLLILGGGDGLLIREILKYPDLENITLIELDETMIGLAKNYLPLSALNQNSLQSPKVNVIAEDAFSWAKRCSTENFDGAFIDFPHPYSIELSRLYSLEFYNLVKRCLSPKGFIIFDFPFFNTNNESLAFYPNKKNESLLINTLSKAGFSNIFVFGPKESFLFATTDNRAIAFKYDSLLPRVSNFSLNNMVPIDVSKHQTSKDQSVNSIFKPYFLIKTGNTFNN